MREIMVLSRGTITSQIPPFSPTETYASKSHSKKTPLDPRSYFQNTFLPDGKGFVGQCYDKGISPTQT